MDLNVSVYYEKCRVIISALESAPEGDRDTLLWMLEECFDQLGRAIENH